jgi:hypothetical protein
MNVPAMYYVGLIANVIFLALSIFSYFYISRKTGVKYLFLIIFAVGWLFSALSYVFLVAGSSADIWYITVIRVVFYVTFLATIVSLIFELSRSQ